MNPLGTLLLGCPISFFSMSTNETITDEMIIDGTITDGTITDETTTGGMITVIGDTLLHSEVLVITYTILVDWSMN